MFIYATLFDEANNKTLQKGVNVRDPYHGCISAN